MGGMASFDIFHEVSIYNSVKSLGSRSSSIPGWFISSDLTSVDLENADSQRRVRVVAGAVGSVRWFWIAQIWWAELPGDCIQMAAQPAGPYLVPWRRILLQSSFIQFWKVILHVRQASACGVTICPTTCHWFYSETNEETLTVATEPNFTIRCLHMSLILKIFQ